MTATNGSTAMKFVMIGERMVNLAHLVEAFAMSQGNVNHKLLYTTDNDAEMHGVNFPTAAARDAALAALRAACGVDAQPATQSQPVTREQVVRILRRNPGTVDDDADAIMALFANAPAQPAKTVTVAQLEAEVIKSGRFAPSLRRHVGETIVEG